MSDYTFENYDALKEAVNGWGEVHAPLKDEDYEVELRSGQVTWHDHEEAVSIKQHGRHVTTFQFDDFLNPYCPQDYKHDH